MKFYQSTVSAVLTLTTLAALQSASFASSKFETITQPLGMRSTHTTDISEAGQWVLPVSKLEAITQPLEPAHLLPQSRTTSLDQISVTSSGQTFFNHPPRLIHASAVHPGSNISSAYEFKLKVPENAGQPLKAVQITQVQNLEAIRFEPSESQAFASSKLAKNVEVPLSSIGGSQSDNSSEITVVFDQPVPPGQTVTVSVQADANPNYGGIYLFGVTAYPDGSNSLGQFIGYGRIHFDGHSD